MHNAGVSEWLSSRNQVATHAADVVEKEELFYTVAEKLNWYSQKCQLGPGRVVHTFNTNTWEAEAGGSL